MDLTRGYAADEEARLVPPGLSQLVYERNFVFGEGLPTSPAWLQTPSTDASTASTGTGGVVTHSAGSPGSYLINTGSTLDGVARLATAGIPLNQYAAVMFQCFGVQFSNQNAAADDIDATISFGIHNVSPTGASNAGIRLIQRGAPAQVITATLTGAPTGGTHRLSVSVNGGTPRETPNLAYNTSAAAVQTALQALANVGSGNLTVSGSAGGPYTITPAGSLASADVVVLSTTNALTGGTAPAVSIVSTRDSTARFLVPGAAGDFKPFGESFRTKREPYRFRNMGFLLYRTGQAVYFEDDPANPVGTIDASGLMLSGTVVGALSMQTKAAVNQTLRMGGARLTLWREPETL